MSTEVQYLFEVMAFKSTYNFEFTFLEGFLWLSFTPDVIISILGAVRACLRYTLEL